MERTRMSASSVARLAAPAALAFLAGLAVVAGLHARANAQPGHDQSRAATMPAPPTSPPGTPPSASGRSQPWLLNNPSPHVIAAARANPAVSAVDKFAARAQSIEDRARLRAYEGAPPVIPHSITGINIQTCLACHAQGIQAGDKNARMISHAVLTNCTQCHVESASPMLGKDPVPANDFAGHFTGGYGGARAWPGAPPVMPHTTFMRTNCVSCHGDFGYIGWRPDHLSRSNCVQCHAPAGEFDQLSPAFNVPDHPDGDLPQREP